MSKRPWLPLYVADYLIDTADLSMEEHGCYLLLLMTAWRRPDNGLPNDMAWVRSILPAMHGHTFNRVVPAILKRFFVLGADNVFHSPRLDIERQKADKRSANQKQNADKRWAEVRENKDLADAKAMPSQSQSQLRVIEFREPGKKRDWPYHGCLSKRRGTIWLQHGSSDFEAYAADYRRKNRIDPPLDANGGHWFPLLGEVAGCKD